MKECIWPRPELIVQIEFLEWTGADCLETYQIHWLARRQGSVEGGSGKLDATTRRRRLFEVLRGYVYTFGRSVDCLQGLNIL
jgi:hypothetical protein